MAAFPWSCLSMILESFPWLSMLYDKDSMAVHGPWNGCHVKTFWSVSTKVTFIKNAEYILGHGCFFTELTSLKKNSIRSVSFKQCSFRMSVKWEQYFLIRESKWGLFSRRIIPHCYKVFVFIHIELDDLFRIQMFWNFKCLQVKCWASKIILCFPKFRRNLDYNALKFVMIDFMYKTNFIYFDVHSKNAAGKIKCDGRMQIVLDVKLPANSGKIINMLCLPVVSVRNLRYFTCGRV